MVLKQPILYLLDNLLYLVNESVSEKNGCRTGGSRDMFSLGKTWMDRITSEGTRATVRVRCFGYVARVAKLRLFETKHVQ